MPGGGASAIGLDLGTLSGQGLDFAFSNGETYRVSSTASYVNDLVSFLGFTFATPFSSLSITFSPGVGDDGLIIDDVRFGSVVPEPSSAVLLALGSGGLLAAARRCRRASAG